MQTLIIVAIVSFSLSFAAKLAADVWLHARVAVIGSFAGLLPSRNPGIAFGIRLPAGAQTALILCALALVAVTAWRSRGGAARQAGFGLILGGALANVADRLRDGLVTDFFQVGTFPVFNVADSCITIGVMILLLESAGVFKQRTATR